MSNTLCNKLHLNRQIKLNTILQKESIVQPIKTRIRKIFSNFYSFHESYGPFVRIGDIMGVNWCLSGCHEPYLNTFIDHWVESGYRDFFIDIGANIGLTTFQNSDKFQHTFCFEPNELVFNVLRTNIALTKKPSSCRAYMVGLGETRKVSELWIPKHNLGGAFIFSDNDYDESTLAEKDGFRSLENSNYLTTDITVEDKKFFVDKVVKRLMKGEKGIIKVDVEGYERQVLSILVKSLSGHGFVAILENWHRTTPEQILQGIETEKLNLQFYRIHDNIENNNLLKKIFRYATKGRIKQMYKISNTEKILPNQEYVVHNIV